MIYSRKIGQMGLHDELRVVQQWPLERLRTWYMFDAQGWVPL